MIAIHRDWIQLLYHFGRGVIFEEIELNGKQGKENLEDTAIK
jgi:hypothetical protein